MSKQIPQAGDWVVVKSPQEIAETLDGNGTLDGLPFMPEMLEHCGKRYRILRRAEKTCIEFPGGAYKVREFLHNDVVLLDELRCSGANHDGCQRLCMFFWKSAWLNQSGAGDFDPASYPLHELKSLSSKLKTRGEAPRYFCQSTELKNATRAESLKPHEIIQKCFREVRTGAVGISEMLGLIAVPLYRKIRDRLFGRPRLMGDLTRTPLGSLNLQPGELVKIKSLEEMRETLDTKGRNRGLVCDIELKKFCGTTDRVKTRLEKMISEATGEMRKMEATVILEGNLCMCARVLGGCPRMDFCYWRELWLERVEPVPAAQTVAEHTVQV